jgi:beta-glucosidase
MIKMLKIHFLITFSLLTNINCQSEAILSLLSKLSIEEKCGQMTHITLDFLQTDQRPSDPNQNPVNTTKLIEAIRDKRVGSIQNVPFGIAQKAETWIQITNQIKLLSAIHNPKIPILYGIDSIHGANYIREATLFPQPLAMASSFNLDIAASIARVTSLETRAVGIQWNFNPVLDVARQPIWSRTWESYGEDTFLAGRIGEAYIKAHQGRGLKNRSVSATCMKHFVGYSVPFNGKDRTPAHLPESLLREVFLPPFEAAIKAGCLTVMVNSGEVNNVPGHANGRYINEILKGELGFEGLVVSDWDDVMRLHKRDGIAETPDEAVRLAVVSGVDQSISPFGYDFYESCVRLAKRDEVFLDRATDATRRILKVKEELGLFDDVAQKQECKFIFNYLKLNCYYMDYRELPLPLIVQGPFFFY